MNRVISLLTVATLSIATTILYLHRLGSAVPYLAIEEVNQARHALILADTGRNGVGERVPLYFPETVYKAGRDPVWVYLAAGLLKVLPFSEAVVRAPSAGAGVLNVILMFLVAREIFGRTGPAVLAASMLALTPAHFTQSRIASSQISTVTAVMAWLVFLVRYVNRDQPRDAFLATFCLGLGIYAYPAALIITPTHFLVTLVVVRLHDRGGRLTSVLVAPCAGLALAVAPLVIWHVFHPDRVAALATYYTHGQYNKNLGAQGFFGANAVDHLDAWWNSYNPDRLFFSGDPDLRFSTRTTGYFLLPVGALMLVGAWNARRAVRAEIQVLLLSGLALAALPAALVGDFALKRWMTILPFGILAAMCGTRWLFAGGRSAVRVFTLALLPLVRWLAFGPSIVPVAVCGVLWMLARRRYAATACATVMLLLGAVQANRFFTFYFGVYGADTYEYFGGNLRGAIQSALDVSGPEDCVFLDPAVTYLEQHWAFYARAYGRADVLDRTDRLDDKAHVVPSLCRGTTIVVGASDPRFSDIPSITVPELHGPTRIVVRHQSAS